MAQCGTRHSDGKIYISLETYKVDALKIKTCGSNRQISIYESGRQKSLINQADKTKTYQSGRQKKIFIRQTKKTHLLIRQPKKGPINQ